MTGATDRVIRAMSYATSVTRADRDNGLIIITSASDIGLFYYHGQSLKGGTEIDLVNRLNQKHFCNYHFTYKILERSLDWTLVLIPDDNVTLLK